MRNAHTSARALAWLVYIEFLILYKLAFVAHFCMAHDGTQYNDMEENVFDDERPPSLGAVHCTVHTQLQPHIELYSLFVAFGSAAVKCCAFIFIHKSSL